MSVPLKRERMVERLLVGGALRERKIRMMDFMSSSLQKTH
mgnify:CR=1 FL=1